MVFYILKVKLQLDDVHILYFQSVQGIYGNFHNHAFQLILFLNDLTFESITIFLHPVYYNSNTKTYFLF